MLLVLELTSLLVLHVIFSQHNVFSIKIFLFFYHVIIQSYIRDTNKENIIFHIYSFLLYFNWLKSIVKWDKTIRLYKVFFLGIGL